MFTDLFNNPLSFLFGAISLIVAISIHEFAHALVADRLGDPTPRLQGRLTLNPLAHLDPLGTLMLLFLRFGWGKPVQFDPYNLRHPRRDAALISIAGPISNIALAVAISLLLRAVIDIRFVFLHNEVLNVIYYLFLGLSRPLLMLNVMLAVFNLIPIHPLDGFKIVEGILPEEYASQWKQLEPYGMLFLLFLIFPFGTSSPISLILNPALSFILSLLLPGGSLI